MDKVNFEAMDPHIQRFLAMVKIGASPKTMSTASARRASFEQLMRFSRAPEAEIDSRPLQVVGHPTILCRVYAAKELTAPSGCLVYFHGGGLVAGSLDTHDALCRTLALTGRIQVVSVGYRLAPEHPFPAAVIDALRATLWVLRHAAQLNAAPERIAVGGDSGGGTLAAIVTQVMATLKPGALCAQILLCPALDFASESASRRQFAEGFLLDASTIAADLVHYAPGRSLEDRRISPARAPSVEALPITVLHTAGFDPLVDEGAAYAARLTRAGVKVQYRCHASLTHHFYALDGISPAARHALEDIAREVGAALA